MLALRVIIILIIVSGAIAYIGDKVGRIIGRRRLSVFGMRPRYTAVAITIVSGILIASITFGTFMVLSREARLALFGLEDLRQKIVSLEKMKNNLEKEVEVRKRGSLLFRNGEVVLTTLLPGGLTQEDSNAKLNQVLTLLDLYVANLGAELKEGSLIYISKDDFKKAVNHLSQKAEDQVLQVKVSRNVLFDEKIPVEFYFVPNHLVFSEKEEIVKSAISSDLNDPQIERELQVLLSQARITAQKNGVIPDASGSMGSIAYAEIFSTVKEIKKRKGPVSVAVVANRPIYSIGPLNVSFKL